MAALPISFQDIFVDRSGVLYFVQRHYIGCYIIHRQQRAWGAFTLQLSVRFHDFLVCRH